MKFQRILTATTSLFLLLFLFSAAAATEVGPDDILGVWLIEEDGVVVEKVEIFPCGEKFCGKIVWLKPAADSEEPATDAKNNDEELRERPLLGLEVMQGYEFNGEEAWQDGDFYAHRKGRTVSPKLTLIDSNTLRIQVKILFIKKSMIWQREIKP